MIEDTIIFDEEVVAIVPMLYQLPHFEIAFYKRNFHIYHKESSKEFTITVEDLYKIIN